MPLKPHPTDPDKMVYASRWYDIPQLQGVTTAQPAQEPRLDQGPDYERGFIDGMQKQAQSSVDKAVNRMAQRPWVDLTDAEKDGKRVLENGLLFNAAEVQAWELGVEYAEAKLKEKNNG